MKNHVSGVNAVLEQALGELEAEKDRIDEQIAVVRSVFNNGAGPAVHSRRAAQPAVQPAQKTGRRPMSAAARREVSVRMSRYWAGRRAAKAKAARIAARPRRVVRRAKPIVVRVVRKRRRPVAKVVSRVARPVARKKPVTRKSVARKAVVRKARSVRKKEIAQVEAPAEIQAQEPVIA